MINERTNIRLASPDSCIGCGACMQSCAKGAISMIENREGFLQPRIDTKSCAGCQKCKQVCPILNPISFPQISETKAYAIINLYEEVRMLSSSGGVFYALAEWMIEQGGVVFGARWDEKWEVMHDYAENMDGVKAFMQSKYVQSRVGDTYKQAKRFLDKGRWVLYSGTPCQIGGLHKFLGKDYDKLIMVDLICHGVPSPGVWRKYLKDYLPSDKVLHINFRDKTNGWKDSQYFTTTTTTTTTTRVKKTYHPYFQAFVKDVILRNCCYECGFKGSHRLSDFTLGDFWGIEHLRPQLFDDKGTSLVFVHSLKGLDILNQLHLKKDILSFAEINTALINNPSMIRSAIRPLNRDVYFTLYRWFRFTMIEPIIYKRIFFYQRCKRKLKKILNKYLVG